MSSILSSMSSQTTAEWCILFITALFIGMSKTGFQGINMLMIPVMAVVFGAKPSTGVILPMLCFSDLLAVWYYRRQAQWIYIFKLLPYALTGFILAIIADRFVPPAEFKRLLASCLLIGIGVMLWSEFAGKKASLPVSRWWYSPAFGLMGGFTTMIGNAAGPVMSIYMLSVRLPKLTFVGTSAWFFLVINYLKLPIQIWAWHNITPATLILNLYTIPFMIAGAVIGILLVRKLPEKGFRTVVTIITILSSLILFL
ncbi:MAG: sulfite exporter TauE/SafE family protein [Tannerellaceae bacterium]|jgi:uncharacterized membrane protein YfcA|nr:sulfite exporter TauE/SafE family protein [Tannerellaceae bacterium]